MPDKTLKPNILILMADQLSGTWFPDGPDADHIVLLHVEGWSAEYWDSPGGRVASLISYAKAKVTGTPYDGGENEKVEL